jgi:hypothetical protein
MTRWRRVNPSIASGGDVGGDVQATESYSVRFRPVSEPDDGLFAMVTAYFYGAKLHGRCWVQEQVEFLVCSDPQDPGSSEVWSDYRVMDHDQARSVGLADQAARDMAASLDGHGLTWDGRSEIR